MIVTAAIMYVIIAYVLTANGFNVQLWPAEIRTFYYVMLVFAGLFYALSNWYIRKRYEDTEK